MSNAGRSFFGPICCIFKRKDTRDASTAHVSTVSWCLSNRLLRRCRARGQNNVSNGQAPSGRRLLCRCIHHLWVLSLKPQMRSECAHTLLTRMPSDTRIHLPVWIISGFPQRAIEPLLFLLSPRPSPVSFRPQRGSSHAA